MLGPGLDKAPEDKSRGQLKKGHQGQIHSLSTDWMMGLRVRTVLVWVTGRRRITGAIRTKVEKQVGGGVTQSWGDTYSVEGTRKKESGTEGSDCKLFRQRRWHEPGRRQ